jgi:hypothetical protein
MRSRTRRQANQPGLLLNRYSSTSQARRAKIQPGKLIIDIATGQVEDQKNPVATYSFSVDLEIIPAPMWAGVFLR